MTTYAVQQHFIGEWDDNFETDNKELALAKYEAMRHETPRRVRLIERTESVMKVDNKFMSDWAVNQEDVDSNPSKHTT